MTEHGPSTQTPDAVKPPRPPAPDLGFFAGAPSTVVGSGFVGGAQPGGTPGSSPFGTPQAGPFDAPPPPPPAGPFGVPPSPPPAAVVTAPSGWPASKIAKRIGIPVAVALVLGIFGVGVLGGLAGLLAGDLKLPPTLQGLPLSSEPAAVNAASTLEADLERRNSGDAVAGGYGDMTSMLFLVGQRTHASPEREMADANVSSTTVVGDNTCGTSTDGLSVCLRTSRSTTIIVIGSLPLSQVSAAVDEAWDAQ
jgi:hypothetical protein